MKRILLIILISFLGRDSIGQPITKRGGASVTVNDENLFVGKSFRVPVFTDTTAANAAVTLDSSGKLIFTYDINGLWLRESNPKKWVEVGSGGGGSGGGIVSLGIVGNYGLTRINDSTYRVDTILIATRARLMHVADSLLTIIGAKPSGSGTTDYLARWTSSSALGIGATRDDGTNVGIGVVPGTYKLNVNGSLNVATSIYLPSSSGTTGNIYKNGTKWLHNGGLAGSQLSNIYLGRDAGNDTALFGNIGIGREALKLNNGYDDIAIGNYAMANSNGYDGGDASSFGIAIGARSMEFATAAHRPLAIGPSTGLYWNNSSVSVIAIGKITASANYGGVGSTYLGASIASQGVKDTADWNSIVGADAWQYLGKAHGNATIGAYIAPNATTASYNSGSGYSALGGLTTGSFNTALSYYAGFGITSGDNNVHIGRFADAYGGNYSNKLVINSDASGSGRHLINGDFSSRKVGIDRSLAEIAAGSQALQVNGSIYATTNIKLGGVTNGNGHKGLRFNTADSLPYLADTTTFSAGFGLMLTGTYPNIHYIIDSSEIATLTALRDSAAAIRAAGGGGGGGTPAGANTEVQYNNSGAFGASANFTYDGTLSLKYSSSAELLKLYAQSSSDAAVVYHHSTPSLKWYTFLDNVGADYNIGTSATPIFKIFRNGHVVNGGATDNGYGYDLQAGDGRFRDKLFVDNNLGVGLTSASAYLHLKAGTATANTAPIKLNTGTALTTPEDGAIEYHGSHIYFTIGSTRYQLDQQGGTNIYNSDGTLTGDRTVDGNGNDLTFTSSTGTPLFNVEYNKIILTSLNSNILMQGDSIILDSESHLIHIDSLLQSVAPTNKMVVWDSVGKKLYSQTIPSAGGSGTVNSGTQYRLAYYATTGTAVSEAAAITASRALISDANGVPTHSATTATEISFVNGVTSAIQTQLDSKLTYSKAKALTFKF